MSSESSGEPRVGLWPGRGRLFLSSPRPVEHDSGLCPHSCERVRFSAASSQCLLGSHLVLFHFRDIKWRQHRAAWSPCLSSALCRCLFSLLPPTFLQPDRFHPLSRAPASTANSKCLKLGPTLSFLLPQPTKLCQRTKLRPEVRLRFLFSIIHMWAPRPVRAHCTP